MKAFLFVLRVHGWMKAFLLDVRKLRGTIEERLSQFLSHWLRTGWQSVISQGKIPRNTLMAGNKKRAAKTDSKIYLFSH